MNVDRALIFLYDSHEHYAINPEVWTIFTTSFSYSVILKITVLTRRVLECGWSEVHISDSV